MKILETPFTDLYQLQPFTAEDNRGIFVKTFTQAVLEENKLETNFTESYYSISQMNVVRGMHFQTPPFDHVKIIYVPRGRILDVVVDVRKNSPSYGKFFTIELSAENKTMLYIGKGFAHGFKAVEDESNVTYLQSCAHAPEHDTGIAYDSFGMNWELENPIVSQRDTTFVKLADFVSPFIFKEKI